MCTISTWNENQKIAIKPVSHIQFIPPTCLPATLRSAPSCSWKFGFGLSAPCFSNCRPFNDEFLWSIVAAIVPFGIISCLCGCQSCFLLQWGAFLGHYLWHPLWLFFCFFLIITNKDTGINYGYAIFRLFRFFFKIRAILFQSLWREYLGI